MRLGFHRPAASTGKILLIIFLVLGLIGVIVAAACGGLFYVGYNEVEKQKTSAEAAAGSFFDLLKAGKTKEAYDSTSTGFKTTTPAQFEALLTSNPVLKNHTSRKQDLGWTGTNMQNVNGVITMTLVYSLTAPDGTKTCTLTMQDDGSGSGFKVHRLSIP